jgi:CD109 antigen
LNSFAQVNSYSPRTSHGEHQFFVFIRAQDAATVMVPIVPTRLGDMEVTISATTLMGMDKVTKRLHVEADGLPQYRHHSILLDLSNRAYVFQYLHVNVTETPIIPYEETRYYIFGSNKATVSVVGDVVGPIFPTMPLNATSLLNLPMDSAEQSMFGFTANLYTTIYMRLINQRNKSLERESFHYLNVGYQRQLSFRNQDGSFSLFRSDW